MLDFLKFIWRDLWNQALKAMPTISMSQMADLRTQNKKQFWGLNFSFILKFLGIIGGVCFFIKFSWWSGLIIFSLLIISGYILQAVYYPQESMRDRLMASAPKNIPQYRDVYRCFKCGNREDPYTVDNIIFKASERQKHCRCGSGMIFTQEKID